MANFINIPRSYGRGSSKTKISLWHLFLFLLIATSFVLGLLIGMATPAQAYICHNPTSRLCRPKVSKKKTPLPISGGKKIVKLMSSAAYLGINPYVSIDGHRGYFYAVPVHEHNSVSFVVESRPKTAPPLYMPKKMFGYTPHINFGGR